MRNIFIHQPMNCRVPKSDDGFVWTSGFSVRMDPDGTDAEIIGHGYRNSYEQVVNSFGNMYQSDNDDYSSCRNSYVLEFGSAGYYSLDGQHKWQADKRPGQAIQRAHWRQDDPGTFDAGDVYGAGGPTGVTFYENGALGEKMGRDILIMRSIRNTVLPTNRNLWVQPTAWIGQILFPLEKLPVKYLKKSGMNGFIFVHLIFQWDRMVLFILQTGTIRALVGTPLVMSHLRERFIV